MDELRRERYQELLDRGWTPEQAKVVMLALLPLDDAESPHTSRFQQEARALAAQFRATKPTDGDPLLVAARATAVLESIRRAAIQSGEPYYATRYDAFVVPHRGAVPTEADRATVPFPVPSVSAAYEQVSEHVAAGKSPRERPMNMTISAWAALIWILGLIVLSVKSVAAAAACLAVPLLVAWALLTLKDKVAPSTIAHWAARIGPLVAITGVAFLVALNPPASTDVGSPLSPDQSTTTSVAPPKPVGHARLSIVMNSNSYCKPEPGGAVIWVSIAIRNSGNASATISPTADFNYSDGGSSTEIYDSATSYSGSEDVVVRPHSTNVAIFTHTYNPQQHWLIRCAGYIDVSNQTGRYLPIVQ